MNNDSDYTKAGFDGFLSRSIDDLSQTNLDSAGPVSTSLRYDSSQVSGMLGDSYRMRNVLFDGKNGRTSYFNNQDPFLLEGELFDGARGIRFQNPSGKGLAQFGVFSNGRVALKVAKDGFDAGTADDVDLVFNSENNLFKIVDSKVVVVPGITTVADGTNTYSGGQTTAYPHELGFAPLVIAFVESSGGYTLMPYSEVVSANDANGGIISNIYRITTTKESVLIFRYAVSYSPGILGQTLSPVNVKYFLLQETAEQDT